jgi:hypothetical protein
MEQALVFRSDEEYRPAGGNGFVSKKVFESKSNPDGRL